MKLRPFLLLFCFFLSLVNAQALTTPLEVDPDTIALWNFDSDDGNIVYDEASDPSNGTAINTLHQASPGLDPVFGLARHFTSIDSFVSFGQAQGSKLDFTNFETLTIEAVVHLSGNAPSYHMIFDNSQIQLAVVGNKLAGFVRVQGGFIGTISDVVLNLNENYRVTYLIQETRLTLFVNGESISTLDLPGPIAPPSYSSLQAFVGGNIFGQFFPGYIDDVRISSVARQDGVPVEIELVNPAPNDVLVEPFPELLVELSDNVGVNPASVKVWLNDIEQTSFLTITETQITGTMNESLRSDRMNIIKIQARDFANNITTEEFEVVYSPNSGGFEYETDSSTLALYHMNDFSRGVLIDSSGKDRHGFVNNLDTLEPLSVVFGNGRNKVADTAITIPPIAIPSQAFTFEGWFKPSKNSNSTVLLSTGQFKIDRYATGHIRVTITTKLRSYVFETTLPVLPLNELRHLAVTWDGNGNSIENLRIFIDRIIVASFDAPTNCDFDSMPILTQMGFNYQGLMDEIRISSTARLSFNIPTIREPGIHFNNLANYTSINTPRPDFNIEINSLTAIDAQNITVFLNQLDVTNSPSLTITSGLVSGQIDTDFQSGLNHLEVRYIDNDGNHFNKISNVFFIKNLGGLVNPIAEETVLYLDFNNETLKDLSKTNMDFEPIYIPSFAPGVINSGLIKPYIYRSSTSPFIELNGRALTYETFIKFVGATSNTTLFRLHSQEGFDFTVVLNPQNGTVQLTGTTPVGSFTGTVISGIPMDGDWHHFGFIVDGSRDFANIILLIDGTIRYVSDFNCACDFSGDFNFSSSMLNSGLTTIDELVINNYAKYEFNLDHDSKPLMTSLTPTNRSSVSQTAPVDLSIVLSDVDGISDDFSLTLNGEEVEGLTMNQSGYEGYITGQVSGLVAGLNIFELKFKDLQNNQTIELFTYFAFGALPAGEYTTDVDTLLLYHFNESTGSSSAQDNSGFARNADVYGGTFEEEGVFGTTGVRVGSYVYRQGPELYNLNSYTIEGWVKIESLNMNYSFFEAGQVRIFIENQRLRVTAVGNAGFINLPNALSDSLGEWIHIALVVDDSQKIAHLLVNGERLASVGLTETEMRINSGWIYLMYGSGGVNLLEEFRLSTVARYSLISDLE